MIREAKPEDIDAIYKLGRECHDLAATKFRIDAVQARKTVAMFVNSPRYFAYIKEVDGEILGALLGFVERVWFSMDKEASDLFFYVRSDPRSIGAGKILLKRFIRWGYEHGANGISMAVSFGGSKAVDTGKIYRKLGFATVGGVFLLQDQLEEIADERLTQIR
jgi:GNAT superfamily N-acetyltransferase